MTGANVTQAASLFLGAVSVGVQPVTGSSQEMSGEGFSQVMSQTAGTKATENVSSKMDERPPSTPTKVETDSRKAVADASEKSSSAETDEKPSVSGKTEEMLEEAVDEVKKAITAELGITVEELEQAMEVLGLTGLDLLNPDNMQGLVAQLSGEGDLVNLLTNGELFESVQDLTAVVEEVNADLLNRLGISEEQFAGLLEEAAKQMNEPQAEGLVNQTDDVEVLAEADGKQNGDITADRTPVVEVERKLPEEANDDEGDNAREVKSGAEETLAAKQQNPQGAETEGQTVEDEKTSETVQVRTVSEHGKERQEGSQENGNSFLQDFARQGVSSPDSNVVDAKAPPFETVDTYRIMEQITEYMKVQVKSDVTELTLQLQPESLGTLNIHLSAKEGVITAQFSAQNEAVKAALETQIVQLKENLNEQGLKVEAVEVTVASHDFNRSLRQGAGENPQGEGRAPKKKSLRRIQLDEGIALEDMALSEEEKITAEMMEQNGNTVDYTA